MKVASISTFALFAGAVIHTVIEYVPAGELVVQLLACANVVFVCETAMTMKKVIMSNLRMRRDVIKIM